MNENIFTGNSFHGSMNPEEGVEELNKLSSYIVKKRRSLRSLIEGDWEKSVEAVAVTHVMPLKDGGECLNTGEHVLTVLCTHSYGKKRFPWWKCRMSGSKGRKESCSNSWVKNPHGLLSSLCLLCPAGMSGPGNFSRKNRGDFRRGEANYQR